MRDEVREDGRTQALALALEYRQAGQLGQAALVYRHVLQTDPANADVLGSLGEVYTLQGQFPEALDLYRQALALRPDYADRFLGARALAVLQRKGRMTARRLFAELKNIRAVDNEEAEYARLGDVLGRLQEAGEMPPEWLLPPARRERPIHCLRPDSAGRRQPPFALCAAEVVRDNPNLALRERIQIY